MAAGGENPLDGPAKSAVNAFEGSRRQAGSLRTAEERLATTKRTNLELTWATRVRASVSMDPWPTAEVRIAFQHA
jgi:hypothetical protein